MPGIASCSRTNQHKMKQIFQHACVCVCALDVGNHGHFRKKNRHHHWEMIPIRSRSMPPPPQYWCDSSAAPLPPYECAPISMQCITCESQIFASRAPLPMRSCAFSRTKHTYLARNTASARTSHYLFFSFGLRYLVEQRRDGAALNIIYGPTVRAKKKRASK